MTSDSARRSSLGTVARLPARPVAGSIAARRAREAAGERTVLASLVLLALTASGFAGYAIATGTHEYAVQAVLPAGTAPFTWKKTVAQGRLADPDFDPVTTGSLPDRPVAAAAGLQGPAELPALPPAGAYALRGVADGIATLENREGQRKAALGSVLPGAGRVLSIRRTGAGWVVITTETIIGPVAP
ncbi:MULTISPECIES: hypothetical protein [Methylorubrum]|uniref:hypothetical protein n=1 Tax=Methylorubrum TaxID=2282523 RepID=UPI0020A1D215|nr:MULTISPECIES: hypothetical protein [Methylorubrum]MCP1551363.1 hypothetical protein [Methylorubrum zatmanii]MCP1552021.1 hypothetical protein [Methylorubrum extorquens]MCP1581668.1 hypothetical protein [Methylorubrum extorquens]